jgi:uncharacterized protein YoxC
MVLLCSLLTPHRLQAAKDASGSHKKFVDLFNRIEHFFSRLEIYTGITPTTAMTDIAIEIMVEVLTILGVVTKEVKRGRLSELMSRRLTTPGLTPYLEKYIKKLTGSANIEDSLQRLDKLTQEEVRMASAELLKVTHIIEGEVRDVHSNVQDVGNKVQGVEGRLHDDVQDVGNKVQGVDDTVQVISSDVKVISSEVQGIDDKLDLANRLSSLYQLLVAPIAQIALQGTSLKTVFYDGFPPQIHQSIITSHPKLIITVQLNGFFKAVYSVNGNPLSPSCGFMENVRYS